MVVPNFNFTAWLTPGQSNILVDATGNARITDFGLAVVTQDLESIRTASDGSGNSVRWIAPEILDGRGTYSKEADVFSFAMLTIEVRCSQSTQDQPLTPKYHSPEKVFTGAVPFSDKPPRAAMLAIIGGERPPRPTHPAFTDSFWALTQRCWDQEAHRRPNALRISCSLCVSILALRIVWRPDRFLTCSGTPAWKRLTDRPLTKEDCVSLITDIFSDRSEIETVKRLRGDDAQTFVDVMDKVLPLPHFHLRGLGH